MTVFVQSFFLFLFISLRNVGRTILHRARVFGVYRHYQQYYSNYRTKWERRTCPLYQTPLPPWVKSYTTNVNEIKIMLRWIINDWVLDWLGHFKLASGYQLYLSKEDVSVTWETKDRQKNVLTFLFTSIKCSFSSISLLLNIKGRAPLTNLKL